MRLSRGCLHLRADRLIDDLWVGEAHSTQRNTLQSKVARQRRALGEPPRIVSGAGGYALSVGPWEVDALAIPDHVVTAARLFASGDDRAAAAECASALVLYLGEVLPAAGDGEWVRPHREGLEEARMKLLELQFTARSRLGEVGEAIGELEAAVAAYPFQESLWELLITGLYGAGRQADALAAYNRVKERLAGELGLDPGPELQRLEHRILNHDMSLSSRLRRGTSSGGDALAGNLPSLAVDLVGRVADVDAVSDLLSRKRLVEIVGAGGIGKTAIAIAIARRFGVAGGAAPGGVWLARLETAVSANDVTDTVIAALGVSDGEAALFERFKGTAALLVLDNCEHVTTRCRNWP